MRIGLLETDILYDEFIKEYGSYGLMFEQYFTQLCSNTWGNLPFHNLHKKVRSQKWVSFLA